MTEKIKVEWDKLYVVELSYRKTNPIHRAIAFDIHTETKYCKIFSNSYEDVQEVRDYKKLPFFKIISEITDMRNDFPNNYKLPHEAIK